MMKGYCTNCNSGDESRRIFDVNSEAKYCYCPRCAKRYKPKVAIFNYDKTIYKYNKRAKFYLSNVGQPKYAYQLFAYVLELEPSNKKAKFGRLLSLSYLSTLRRNRFTEVTELLNIVKGEVKGSKDMTKYSNFLLSLDHSVNEYMHRVRKNLCIHDYFYDVECVKLYFKHLRDAIALKRVIAGELINANNKKGSEQVFETVKNMELVYNQVIYTADGQDHYFTNFTKSGDLLIVDGKKPIDTKLGTKYKRYSLNKGVKNTKVLGEIVFSKAYFRIFRVYEKCLVSAVTLLILSIASLITFIAIPSGGLKILFLTLFIVFGALAASFVALYLIFAGILKKPRF